ncbi:MAG: transglutaminase domain-containing protein [Lentisphaerae bacterium]|nr:transglutaminase domain-containing protein [Lentisphaerota bacterium]
MTLRASIATAVAAALALLTCSCASPVRRPSADRRVTIAQIAEGIEKHIAEKTRAEGGYFKLQHNGGELQLKLVRVHLEYLADLGDGVQFACVDLVGTDGTVYDVDFFLKGSPGALTVTEATIHKLNGQPLYAWEQKQDETWSRVALTNASNRLLGVITGKDDQLPALAGAAQLWLPLAQSDAFQTVAIKAINAPTLTRQLDEGKYGNKVLFLMAGPADSGKTVEIQYRVQRAEKYPYAKADPVMQKYLAPDTLAPLNDTFRGIAAEVTRGKPTDLMRARALYDHVIEKIRYARYGPGWGRGDAVYACNWGRGDAVYACNAKSGNCSDFHAYFIALARASGIPARFVSGAAIPAERNDGGIDGYHCWAEFFADGKWWPVDISEADKYSALATYYFGHQPANRFEFSQGRDLVVEPGPASGPINFLAFPVLEVDGQPAKAEVAFSFVRRSVQ